MHDVGGDDGPDLNLHRRGDHQQRGFVFSRQQNALGYNLSMQGMGDVAIDGPRLEEFLRSCKDFF